MPALPSSDREPVVLVRVAEVLGSAPREAGAAMLVGDRDTEGTIGGGALEWRATALARDMLAIGEGRRRVTLPLGPALGQCCGGQVTLELLATDRRTARTVLAREAPDRPLVVLYGAGHVGRAVAGLLATLPCRLRWLDPREGIFPPEIPDHLEAGRLASPQAAVAEAPAGAFHLVMTHSHALDYVLVETLLRRGDFAWLGLIGSATKRRRFERRLRAAGIAAGILTRLVCPIGIAGITGKQPAVIAVATAAQLLLAFEVRRARASLSRTEAAR